MDSFLVRRIGVIVVAVLCAAFIIMVSIIGIRTLNGDDARFKKEKTTQVETTTKAEAVSNPNLSINPDVQAIFDRLDKISTLVQSNVDDSEIRLAEMEQNLTNANNELKNIQESYSELKEQQNTTNKSTPPSSKDLQPQIDALKQELANEKNKNTGANSEIDSLNSQLKLNQQKLNECNKRIETLENQSRQSGYSDEEYKSALKEIEELRAIIKEMQEQNSKDDTVEENTEPVLLEMVVVSTPAAEEEQQADKSAVESSVTEITEEEVLQAASEIEQ